MTVANLLMPVAGLIKVFIIFYFVFFQRKIIFFFQARYRGAKADIDSPFFKLHYRTTATLFFVCCLLGSIDSDGHFADLKMHKENLLDFLVLAVGWRD